MRSDCAQQTLQQAEMLCALRGGRLTQKRKRILDLMLHADRPLSAYQIAELYSERHKQGLSIMSVYRMLSFLTSVQVIHRLETTNQYVACAHIDSADTHDTRHLTAKFLICDQCKQVLETSLREDVLQQLNHDVECSGFTMEQEQLEIHGTCRACADKPDSQGSAQ